MIRAAKKFHVLDRDDWFAIILGVAVAYFIGAGTVLLGMLLNEAPHFPSEHPLTGSVVAGLIIGFVTCVAAVGVVLYVARREKAPKSDD